MTNRIAFVLIILLSLADLALAEAPLEPPVPGSTAGTNLLEPLRNLEYAIHLERRELPELIATAVTAPSPSFQVSKQLLWEPPGFAHRQLLFDDPRLERLGLSHSALLQPAASVIRFQKDVILMPIRTLVPPRSWCESSSGQPRPGSCSSW